MHSTSSGQWQRHGLVWPHAASWPGLLAQVPAAYQAAVRNWAQKNWPLVLARQNLCVDQIAADSELVLDFGLPLPIDKNGDKPKIALRMPRASIRHHRPALRLSSVLNRLTPTRQRDAASAASWQEQWQALKALQQACAAQQLTMQVYGSWAWQAITGLPYLHAASDLDLLFTPQNRTQLASGLALLQGFVAPMRLDGEIVFADGSAVAWREWAQSVQAVQDACAGSVQVLVKRHGGLSLQPPAQLLAKLAELAPAGQQHTEGEVC